MDEEDSAATDAIAETRCTSLTHELQRDVVKIIKEAHTDLEF
jgi:hypothetical protein